MWIRSLRRHPSLGIVRTIRLGLPALIVSAGTAALAQFGPVQVETVPAEERGIREGITLVGDTRPLRTSVVGAEVEGQVRELLVEEGAWVTAGQVLAKLNTDVLEIHLDSAKALLRLREAELAELRNGSRPEEIERAKSELDSARAEKDYWIWQVEQKRTLFEQKVSSEEALQEASRALRRAEMAEKVAQAVLELAVEGPRRERIAQAEAQAEVQRQEIRRIEDSIQRHTITAPFEGVIVFKSIEIGEWIDKGDALLTLADLSRFEVEVHVPEYQIVGVLPGDEATARLAALPGRIFSGEVAVVIPQADPNSRTFPVRLRVENPLEAGMPMVKSGMFASVTLASGPASAAILVPKDALVLGGPVPSVYIAEADIENPTMTVARMAPVELGATHEGWIQVKGDVRPGDPVIVYGNERLRPGQAVRPSPQVTAAPADLPPSAGGRG